MARRLRDNWYETAAAVAGLPDAEASSLGVPLRLRAEVARMLARAQQPAVAGGSGGGTQQPVAGGTGRPEGQAHQMPPQAVSMVSKVFAWFGNTGSPATGAGAAAKPPAAANDPAVSAAVPAPGLVAGKRVAAVPSAAAASVPVAAAGPAGGPSAPAPAPAVSTARRLVRSSTAGERDAAALSGAAADAPSAAVAAAEPAGSPSAASLAAGTDSAPAPGSGAAAAGAAAAPSSGEPAVRASATVLGAPAAPGAAAALGPAAWVPIEDRRCPPMNRFAHRYADAPTVTKRRGARTREGRYALQVSARPAGSGHPAGVAHAARRPARSLLAAAGSAAAFGAAPVLWARTICPLPVARTHARTPLPAPRSQAAEMPPALAREFDAFNNFCTRRFYGQQSEPVAAVTANKYADHMR